MVASHPIPNAPVATNRLMMPGMATPSLVSPGMRYVFRDKPPNSASRKKQIVSAPEPKRRRVRRPRASMRSQASVIRMK